MLFPSTANNNSGGGYKKSYNNDGGDRPRYNRNRDNENGDGEDGGRKPYRRRDDGEGGGDRPRFNRNRDENGDGEDGGRKPYRRREDGEGGGDRPRFNRNRDENGDGEDGGRKPFKRRDGDNEEGGDGEGEKKKEIYVPEEPSTDEKEIFGSTIKSGINFKKFESIPVKVTENIPKLLTSFKTSGLRDYLLQNIEKAGYETLTPIQKAAIPAIMKGIDLMACAQTGSGKVSLRLLLTNKSTFLVLVFASHHASLALSSPRLCVLNTSHSSPPFVSLPHSMSLPHSRTVVSPLSVSSPPSIQALVRLANSVTFLHRPRLTCCRF